MSVDEQREYKPGGVTGKGFLPGQSGNPNGRPKGQSITSVLRAILDDEAKFKGNTNGKLLKEIVADVLVKHALKGNMKAMSILLDRHDGKVPLPLTIQDDDFDPTKLSDEKLESIAKSTRRRRT